MAPSPAQKRKGDGISCSYPSEYPGVAPVKVVGTAKGSARLMCIMHASMCECVAVCVACCHATHSHIHALCVACCNMHARSHCMSAVEFGELRVVYEEANSTRCYTRKSLSGQALLKRVDLILRRRCEASPDMSTSFPSGVILRPTGT